LTIWHCILSAEFIKTHFFRLFFGHFSLLGSNLFVLFKCFCFCLHLRTKVNRRMAATRSLSQSEPDIPSHYNETAQPYGVEDDDVIGFSERLGDSKDVVKLFLQNLFLKNSSQLLLMTFPRYLVRKPIFHRRTRRRR